MNIWEKLKYALIGVGSTVVAVVLWIVAGKPNPFNSGRVGRVDDDYRRAGERLAHSQEQLRAERERIASLRVQTEADRRRVESATDSVRRAREILQRAKDRSEQEQDH